MRLWALGLVLLLSVSVSWAETNQPSEQELKALITEMEKIQAWLDKVNRERSQLQQELGKTEKEIGTNLQRIEQLEQELGRLKKLIAELTQQQASLRQQLDQQKQSIEQLLIAAYKQGRQGQLKLILNQSNPVELHRMLSYAGYLSSDQQQQLHQYQTNLIALNHTQQQLLGQQQQLNQSNQALAQTNQQLRQKQNDRQQILARLDQQVKSGAEQLGVMKAERASLEALLARMQETLEQLVPTELDTPFASLKGNLNWPVTGKVVHRYGDRIGKGPLRWEGILVDGKTGTEVDAVHHGRVVFADWLKGFGLLVILDHGDGYMSLYGRNEVLLRSVGEWVNAGDALARTGDGGLDEQGLYFEVRYQGRPQNPLRWLARR